MDRSSVDIDLESRWSYFCFVMLSDLPTPQLYVYNRETVLKVQGNGANGDTDINGDRDLCGCLIYTRAILKLSKNLIRFDVVTLITVSFSHLILAQIAIATNWTTKFDGVWQHLSDTSWIRNYFTRRWH
jgi:hypothetical protein